MWFGRFGKGLFTIFFLFFFTSDIIMTSPCDPPPSSLTSPKYFPLQLPTSILVYGRVHSLIFHGHVVEKHPSRQPSPLPYLTSR